MKAVNHYVGVEKIKEAETKVGGLIITEDNNTEVRYFKGKVVSEGNLVEEIVKTTPEGNVVDEIVTTTPEGNVVDEIVTTTPEVEIQQTIDVKEP